MKLTLEGIKNQEAWKEAGIALPGYDVEAVAEKAKKEAEAKKVIKTFDEEPELQILNGRYGPYISYKKENYKIPKTVEAADLTLEACFSVIKLQQEKGSGRKTTRSTAKKK